MVCGNRLSYHLDEFFPKYEEVKIFHVYLTITEFRLAVSWLISPRNKQSDKSGRGDYVDGNNLKADARLVIFGTLIFVQGDYGCQH